ncbi:hypothetical protein N9X61_00805 [Sulfurimonas sp.]|nr:hypothetical protein [Sulfurimonas sp.]
MKKNITALSFTPKYDELEDRIRISINYDDFNNRVDFMMTRSFVLKLFPILDDYMSKFYSLDIEVEPAAPKNQKEMIKQDKSTSLTDGSNLELYKQEDELLREVKFSFVKETKISIIMFESNVTQATAHLDANSLKQIFTIIKSTIPFFSWGISHNL